MKKKAVKQPVTSAPVKSSKSGKLSDRLANIKEDMQGHEIRIRDITRSKVFGWGPHGEEVAKQLKTSLADKGKATVNFDGITGHATYPVEVAFGWLIDEYGKEVFDRKVTITASTPKDAGEFKATILGICARRGK